MKKIFLSAILAGAVIAFGGTVFLSVENTVVGSLFFTIGLFVVCTRGLHLFTGKVCYVFDNDMAYAKTLPVKAGKKAAALLVHTARIPKRHDIVQYMAEVIFRKLLQFFFVHDNSSPGICLPPVTP